MHQAVAAEQQVRTGQGVHGEVQDEKAAPVMGEASLMFRDQRRQQIGPNVLGHRESQLAHPAEITAR